MNLDEVRAQLEDKLSNLEARLEKVSRDVTQSHSTDSAEQAQERENDEVIDAIGEETEKSIHNVKLALHRIDSGEYGICVTCGNSINPERLAVIPESVSCISCA